MRKRCADELFLHNQSGLRGSLTVYLPLPGLRTAEKCLVSEIGPVKVTQTSAQLYNNFNLALVSLIPTLSAAPTDLRCGNVILLLFFFKNAPTAVSGPEIAA